jgi:pSer/pThr/pTyr-binding forkhead associated (FHA) protein
MVPEAVIVALRIVILVLLWGFVLAAVVAVRHDIFGGRRMTPAPPRPAAPSPAKPAPTKAPAPEATAPRQLVVTDGPLAGTSLPLAGGSISIGRSPDSTLVLRDDFASTHHARLSRRETGWVIEDLGSTNGTFVGRSRVREPVPVAPGQPIRIGRTVLELRP